jgi:lipoprotein-anchoring transpeptidase ErfK/SrfK
VDTWSTPLGELNTHWKTISQHMAGGTARSGYDTPAVSWATYVHGDGVAIHAAFWHNDFGSPRSHGCINCRPEDAKWIFRWSTPYISLEQSEMRMTWPDHGTVVKVVALQ